jgi:hypothetical protein
MSVGLYLLAKFNRPIQDTDDLLQKTSTWIHEYCPDLVPETRQGFVDTYPTLFCQLHPGAEELELSLIDLEHLTATANTSSAGPGYHIFVCSMLQEWAQAFSASWSQSDEDSDTTCDGEVLFADEAEYFFTGEAQRVFDHMTLWLRTLAGSFFDGTIEQDQDIALCMPMGVRFEWGERAITPVGPRNDDWLLRTSRDPLEGKDFFPWWTPGLSAEYFLGRALVAMWVNVRWRPPVNDSERKLLQYVADSFKKAYGLDPTLDYPWEEWGEVLNFLGGKSDTGKSPLTDISGSRIGYRRRNVTTSLPGGWQITLPGSFSEFALDENNDLYALDPPREIWFTSYSFTGDAKRMFESARREILQDRTALLHEGEDYVGKAEIRQKESESGEKYFILSSSNIRPTQRAVCTIVFMQPEHRDWAIGVWRSLQPPAVNKP